VISIIRFKKIIRKRRYPNISSVLRIGKDLLFLIESSNKNIKIVKNISIRAKKSSGLNGFAKVKIRIEIIATSPNKITVIDLFIIFSSGFRHYLLF
jgi:hypothetical protein